MKQVLNFKGKLSIIIGLFVMPAVFGHGNAEEILDRYLDVIPQQKMDRAQAEEFGQALLHIRDQTKRTFGVQAACCYVIRSVCESGSNPQQEAVLDTLLGFLKELWQPVLSPEPEPTVKDWYSMERAKGILVNTSQLEKYIDEYTAGVNNVSKIKIGYRITLPDLERLLSAVPDITHLEILNGINVKGSDLLKRVPDVALWIQINNKEELENLFTSVDQPITNVSIFYPQFKNDELKKLIEAYPNLTGLTLMGCGEISDVSSIGSLEKITELRLCGCDMIKNIEFIRGIKSVTKLSLTGLKDLRLRWFNPINYDNISCLENLRELDLSYSGGVLNENINKIVKGCPELTVLSMKGWKNDVTDFSSLKQLSKLRELHLAGHANLTNENLNQISKLESLQLLDLSYCLRVTNLDIAILCNLKNLVSLDLSCGEEFEDEDSIIELFQKDLPHLQNLSVGKKVLNGLKKHEGS